MKAILVTLSVIAWSWVLFLAGLLAFAAHDWFVQRRKRQERQKALEWWEIHCISLALVAEKAREHSSPNADCYAQQFRIADLRLRRELTHYYEHEKP